MGDSPLSTQVKLLRVLQENEIMRLGGTQPIPIDLRIIAATNCNLSSLVEDKSFREDLYYRLNVIPIHLPPLRERKEDIPDLVEFFIGKYNTRHNKTYIQGIDPDALNVFERYPWPGNVRELENVIERAVVLETEKKIRKTSLPDELLSELSSDKVQVPELDQNNIDLEKTLDQIEKKMIKNALMRSDGIINKAAETLNLSFRSMRYRIEKHKLRGKSKNDE